MDFNLYRKATKLNLSDETLAKMYEEAETDRTGKGLQHLYWHIPDGCQYDDVEDSPANELRKELDKEFVGDVSVIDEDMPYLFDVNFSKVNYKIADILPIEPAIGGCSSFSNGSYVARNLDWFYSEIVDFVVNTDHYEDSNDDMIFNDDNCRYASVGIASVTALTRDVVEDVIRTHKVNKDFLSIPFNVLDGVNEKGVYANLNVVSMEKDPAYVSGDYANIWTHTTPLGEKKWEIDGMALPRFILDNFKYADEALDYIVNHVQVNFSMMLLQYGYHTHWMIAGPTSDSPTTYTTYVMEIMPKADDTSNCVLTYDEQNIMTNFHIFKNADGDKVQLDPCYSTYDKYMGTLPTGITALVELGYTPNSSGLERYKILYNESHGKTLNKEEMRNAINKVLYGIGTYTNADDSDDLADFWAGEFVGYSFNIDSDIEEIKAVAKNYKDVYLNRKRSGMASPPWISTHSCVYDLDNKKIYIVAQEKELGDVEYVAELGEKTIF